VGCEWDGCENVGCMGEETWVVSGMGMKMLGAWERKHGL
jgi:hypothetical protein